MEASAAATVWGGRVSRSPASSILGHAAPADGTAADACCGSGGGTGQEQCSPFKPAAGIPDVADGCAPGAKVVGMAPVSEGRGAEDGPSVVLRAADPDAV
jgi:hypothetical protein